MNQSVEQLIPLIPLLPLAGAFVNGLFGNRFPRGMVSAIAYLTVGMSFSISLWAFIVLLGAGDGARLSHTLYTWMSVGGLEVDVTFMIDHLSAIMALVVTGVGFLIHVYSVGYMEHEPSLARYFAYLNLFMFAMLVLVLGDSLALMFLGWEGVGLCSYLLIGFWFSDNEKATAGKKAFITNRIGDFGFIIAMALLFRFVGVLDFDGLRAAATSGQISMALATGVTLMLFLGATGKSAQIPLYVWLPDAMAGPTPVSALIHAATMVTAGVYMVVRLNFLFVLAPISMLTVALVGAATAIVAASIGTAQRDIKKVLAYSTVSQLGFMFIAAGIGAYAIAIFHLATHAFFKALLFLGSGSVIHGMSGEQDMRHMGGLWRKMPITFVTFLIATLAITGIVPGLSGFISKDAILWNAWVADHGAYASTFASFGKVIWVTGFLAAGLTSYYMWRLVFMTFFSGELRASEEVKHHVHESSYWMTIPLMLLAVLAFFGGAIGWPHIFGGHEWIVEWLVPIAGHSPVPEGNHVFVESMLMVVSVGIGLVGFAVAFYLYGKRIHPFTTRFSSERPYRWLHLRLLDKWHVDELYEVMIINPLRWFSDVVLYNIFDRWIIDGTVNLVGWLARTLGFFGQLFHGGNIQKYLAVFAVALAILLYGWLTPVSSSLDNTDGVPEVQAEQAQVVIPAKAGEQR